MKTLEKQLEEAQAKAEKEFHILKEAKERITNQIAKIASDIIGSEVTVVMNTYSTTIKVGENRNEISISHDRNYNFKTHEYEPGLKFELGWFASRAVIGSDEKGYLEYLSALGAISKDLLGESRLIPVLTEARESLSKAEAPRYEAVAEVSRIEREIQTSQDDNEKNQIRQLITSAINSDGIIQLTEGDDTLKDQVKRKCWVTFDGITITEHKRAGFFKVVYNELYYFSTPAEKQRRMIDYCHTIRKMSTEDLVVFIQSWKRQAKKAA